MWAGADPRLEESSLLSLNAPTARVADGEPNMPGGRRKLAQQATPQKIPAVEVQGQGLAVTRARPGPWGDLDYYTVFLEASDSLLKSMEFPSYESEWDFIGYDEEQLAKFFTGLALPAAVSGELLDRTKWERRDKHIKVRPTAGAILGLPAEARATIYGTLARWEENPFHREPEVVAGRDVRDWLRRAELTEEVVAVIEKLVYRRGTNLVFADTPLVLRMVQTEDERMTIRKALSRTPTLVVNLRLSPQTDVAALVQYWSGPKRFKDITPFLESVAATPAVSSVDLMHLMPAQARRLLYTYPGSNYGRTGYFPDCHWTSLNFGNFESLDRLADPTLATAYVFENYAKAEGAYRYGDVLFFMDGNTGNAIHSCVYIADDIVYTKNGRSPMQPWVLMKLNDVIAYYSMYYAPQVACWRSKGE